MKKNLRKNKKSLQKKVVRQVIKKSLPRKPAKKVSHNHGVVKAPAKVKKAKPKMKAVSRLEVQARVGITKPHVSKLVEKTSPSYRNLDGGQSMFGPVNIKPYQQGKNEQYMNDKQLEHFRSVLLQWKDQLMAEVDRTMAHLQDEVANYPDPVDRASQEEEFSLELRARDRERKLLRKIEETLGRINDKDYGYCDDCGAEIGIRRLEARPTATQCIECKTVAEIREKQVGENR